MWERLKAGGQGVTEDELRMVSLYRTLDGHELEVNCRRWQKAQWWDRCFACCSPMGSYKESTWLERSNNNNKELYSIIHRQPIMEKNWKIIYTLIFYIYIYTFIYIYIYLQITEQKSNLKITQYCKSTNSSNAQSCSQLFATPWAMLCSNYKKPESFFLRAGKWHIFL